MHTFLSVLYVNTYIKKIINILQKIMHVYRLRWSIISNKNTNTPVLSQCYLPPEHQPLEHSCKFHQNQNKNNFMIISFDHFLWQDTVPNNSYHFCDDLLHKWSFKGMTDIHEY